MNNNDKDKIVPVIVNGEINDGRDKKIKRNNNVKLPTKRFTFADALLTLIGVALVVYGIYNVVNKDNKKETEEVEQKEEVKKEFNIEDLKNYIPTNLDEVYNLYSTEDINAMKTELPVSNLSNNAKLALASRFCETRGEGNNKYFLDTDIESAIKKLFGSINYTKSKFSYGNYTYTYNQETKRYYLLDSTSKLSPEMRLVKYVDLVNNDNTVLVKSYLLYKTNQHTNMVDGTVLNINIDDNNIKDNLSNIRYYEYKFEKEDNDYKLVSISIK